MTNLLRHAADSLEGRVVIVTGGAGGIGRPLTEALADAGMRIAVCDRDPDAIAAITERLNGADALVECFDVRDTPRLSQFFAAVDERFGGLDVLVNVPGGSFIHQALEISDNAIDAIVRQNFTYALRASQLAATRMQAAGTGGSIINISTIEAYRAMPGQAIYGAMKASVENLTKTLAVEWGPHRIRVNTVTPDHLSLDGRSFETEAMFIPLQRGATGAEVAGCVLFLASDLSSYVTGTTIHVDGGTLAAGGWMKLGDRYVNMLPQANVPGVDHPA